MRQATLGLFYLIKYAELIFLLVWSGLVLSSTLWFIDQIQEQPEISDKDVQCIVFTIIVLVLVCFNLLYNNLVINLRFLAKVKCYTTGRCIYDFINILQC